MTSRVLRLPAAGRLLVGTDLQGNLADFRAMERHFLAAGPDAVLVLTGGWGVGFTQVGASARWVI